MTADKYVTKKGPNLGLEMFTAEHNGSFVSAGCECADQSSNRSVWAVKDTSHSWTDGCRGTKASSDFGRNDSEPFCVCLQNMWCWHFILTTAASASDTDLACSARSLYSPSPPAPCCFPTAVVWRCPLRPGRLPCRSVACQVHCEKKAAGLRGPQDGNVSLVKSFLAQNTACAFTLIWLQHIRGGNGKLSFLH